MNKYNCKSFLAISFSKGFNSPNIPIATFYQGDKEINFIVDTGSDYNVIDKSALANIEHEKMQGSGTLTGLEGTQEVEGCNISFGCEDKEYKEFFLVSDTLKQAFDGMKKDHGIAICGMLGSMFLKKHNLVLDFNNLLIYNKS